MIASALLSFVAVAATPLALAAPPTVAPEAPGARAAEIQARQFKLGDLSIGSKEADIRRLFGTPLGVANEPSDAPGEVVRTYTYDGVALLVVDGEIANIRCTTPRHATPDGIRVGESIERVVALLGVGEKIATSPEESTLRYHVAGSDCYLVLRLKERKVTEIELWFDYT